MRRPPANSRGFTLIEMIAVVVIIGILVAAVAPVAWSSLKAYDEVRKDVVTLDKVRYATERMAREMRQVWYDSTSGYALNMSTTAPVFTKRGEGSTICPTTAIANCRVVSISQTLANVTLSYDLPSVSPAPVLTDQASSLSFAYFDDTGATTTDTTLVRYVEISLSLLQGSQTYSQRTRVELRNR
jgi:prepilin-type N-terminal cleavage/methylation domain-containing protein